MGRKHKSAKRKKENMNRNKNFVRLLALVLVVSSLYGGLLVDSASAAIVFTDEQITSNPASQENPDIFEYGRPQNLSIVYQDNRNGNWDIYLSSYQSYVWQPEFRVTNNSSNQINPKISGNIIVWQDDRNGNWDIYIYNITAQTETQITNNTAAQGNPEIDGNYIVWLDNRAGHGAIYGYNLTSHTEQLVHLSTLYGYEDLGSPAISGNRVVWVEHYHDSYPRNKYWLLCRDLSTGSTQTLAYQEWQGLAGVRNVEAPAIYGDRVVWSYEAGDIYYHLTGKDLAASTSFEVGSVYVLETPYERPHLDIYGRYVVYQRAYQVYLHDIDTKSTFKVSNNSLHQMEPRISSQYSNDIVYMDDRNGNYDIYRTSFGYNLLATLPNPSSTGGVINDLDSEWLATVIGSAAVVIVAVIGTAFFVARKRRNSGKSHN